MEIPINNICYLTIILFIIPLIVLPSIILSVKIETSNLESIIKSPMQYSSLCYNQTYSFINEQESDERYLSLHSYLKSFKSVYIVIIITYSIKIIFSICFGLIIEGGMTGDGNAMYLFCFDLPSRILSFIPLIVCVILLRSRSNTENCEAFINYYELCSQVYGDDFKNNFSSIMDIKTYTFWVLILFIVEIVYHAIIFIFVLIL